MMTLADRSKTVARASTASPTPVASTSRQPTHIPVIDEFLHDLLSAVAQAPPAGTGDSGATLYGVTFSLEPGADITTAVLDQLGSRYDA